MWTYIYQWTYIVFLIIFEIGSLLCATASTSKMLIIARAVAGIGAAGIQNGSLTIIARSLPLKKQAGMCNQYRPTLAQIEASVLTMFYQLP